MCTKIVTTVFPVITANTDDGKMANVMNGRICNQFHLRNQPEQIFCDCYQFYIKKWRFNDTFKNHDVPFIINSSTTIGHFLKTAFKASELLPFSKRVRLTNRANFSF